MRQGPDLPAVLDVAVTTHGQLPGSEDYARTRIGELGRLAYQLVLHAHVRLSEHGDPAVARRVIAQANLDVNGRLVRAQVEGVTAAEAIHRLEARLRHRLERSAEHWEAKRGGIPRVGPHEWRRQSEPTHRPTYFPRPESERRIMRHKSYSLPTSTVDEAAVEMELLDYDCHLFTEEGAAGQRAVSRRPRGIRPRTGQSGICRQAGAVRAAPDHQSAASSAAHRRAGNRTDRVAWPTVPVLRRYCPRPGSVLYHRYDGHYGLITPAS